MHILTTVNVLKFQTLFPFFSLTKCWFSGLSSLIWVCSVCLDLFVKQPVFKILELYRMHKGCCTARDFSVQMQKLSDTT